MTATPQPLVIGLGGNVGSEAEIAERFARAREALGQLALGPGPQRSAALYRTAPIGPTQPAFLNTAIRIALADAQPGELIATVLEIERLLGRDRSTSARFGPRRIDLDVLVWGDRRVRTPELELPHPRLGERRFALAPLVDVVGRDFQIPGLGAAGALLDRVADQGCELISERW